MVGGFTGGDCVME